MKIINYLIVLLLLTAVSCSNDFSNYTTYLNGYWEISHVEKDNQMVREFTISPIIDYWQIEDDMTGFRKKVMPNLEGKIIITQHSIPLTVKIENNTFNLYYDDNGVKHKETVLKISETELIITNDEGLKYTYIPYTPLDLTDE